MEGPQTVTFPRYSLRQPEQTISAILEGVGWSVGSAGRGPISWAENAPQWR